MKSRWKLMVSMVAIVLSASACGISSGDEQSQAPTKTPVNAAKTAPAKSVVQLEVFPDDLPMPGVQSVKDGGVYGNSDMLTCAKNVPTTIVPVDTQKSRKGNIVEDSTFKAKFRGKSTEYHLLTFSKGIFANAIIINGAVGGVVRFEGITRTQDVVLVFKTKNFVDQGRFSGDIDEITLCGPIPPKKEKKKK